MTEQQAPTVRTRIPPSPTGIPHLGTARTALFNYLFAKHFGGQFILRIEDTDRARFVPDAEKAIFEMLKWLGLQNDGKVERQSERLEIYKGHADLLRKNEFVYDDKGAIRFKMPKTGQSNWTDAIGNKKITFENKTQEDFVIIKSDGYPTYNFANVIDDHLMEVTHVLRGEEFISSTPKHVQLYKAFGWIHPVFAHLPVILGPDKQKLSKRHGAETALEYKKQGYLKEALLNYLALLGWNPGGNRELMSLSDMIKIFDIKYVNTTNPIFDPLKLTWMNQQYIQMLSDMQLKKEIIEFYPKASELNTDILNKLIPLLKTRMATLNDFIKLTDYFFSAPNITARNTKEKLIVKELQRLLKDLKVWKKDAILSVFKSILISHDIRMPVMYYICTGQEKGLPLPESLEILGKKEVLGRLEKILSNI